MQSLNPFCFGVWGLRFADGETFKVKNYCLNPFCFGVWGLREAKTDAVLSEYKVLILFVLEYGV